MTWLQNEARDRRNHIIVNATFHPAADASLSLMLAYFGLKMPIQREQTAAASPLLLRLHWVAGLFSDVTCSLAGIGGVCVLTFYLTNVGLPLRTAIGTATGAILPISAGAIIGFGLGGGRLQAWRRGYIDLHAVLVMRICTIVATGPGVAAAAATPVVHLRKAFGGFLFALALKTLFSLWR